MLIRKDHVWTSSKVDWYTKKDTWWLLCLDKNWRIIWIWFLEKLYVKNWSFKTICEIKAKIVQGKERKKEITNKQNWIGLRKITIKKVVNNRQNDALRW